MDDGNPSRRDPHGARSPFRVCVLASGSSGNCTVLAYERESVVRHCLIDAGLSPRRTFRLLHQLGVRPDQLDDILFTHFDADHFVHTWLRALPRHATARFHRAHRDAAHALGLSTVPHHAFEDGFSLGPELRVVPRLALHDRLGAACFRFEWRASRGDDPLVASLGFATDVGRMTPGLVAHLRDVSVLAIESNYCPVMQQESGRPLQLQRRIMGGAGHLSNEQSASAVAQIGPRDHLILIHLSRQCNHPSLAARHHSGAPCQLTVSRHDEPTGWICVRAGHDCTAAARRAAELAVEFEHAPLFAALAR